MTQTDCAEVTVGRFVRSFVCLFVRLAEDFGRRRAAVRRSSVVTAVVRRSLFVGRRSLFVVRFCGDNDDDDEDDGDDGDEDDEAMTVTAMAAVTTRTTMLTMVTVVTERTNNSFSAWLVGVCGGWLVGWMNWMDYFVDSL